MEFQRIEAEQARPVVVVITSRVVYGRPNRHSARYDDREAGQFNDDDIADCLGRWRRVNAAAIAEGKMGELTLSAARSQRELARQPLLLLMLALYAADPAVTSLDSGTATADLYQRLIDGFAQREAAATNFGHPGELEQRMRDHIDRLEITALAMFNRGRQDISEEEIGFDLATLNPRLIERTKPAEVGQQVIGEYFFVHTPEASLLAAAAGEAGSRRQSEHREQLRHRYEFLHPTFGEYFVACRVIREVVEVAEVMCAGRRSREPDDDLLYALLSHQPLAARWSTLSFAKEIFNTLPAQQREQVQETIKALLGTYRNRRRSDRYAGYQPIPLDQVRQLVCYSANLTVLRVLFESDESTLLDELLRASDEVLQQWQSTVTFATGMTELRAADRSSRHTDEHVDRTATSPTNSDPLGPSGSREPDPNLLLTIYIPTERLYAAETRKLLELFHDWLTATGKHGIRQSRYRTASGEIFEFHADPATPQPSLREEFNIFSNFLELCANSPATAVDLLNATEIDKASGSELVARFGKEFRRLQVDLRHDRERRIMTLRHTLEGELLEKDIDLRQVPAAQINVLLERLVPGPSAHPSLPGARGASRPSSGVVRKRYGKSEHHQCHGSHGCPERPGHGPPG